jgi:AcrR family transcriptional regulator
MASKVERGGATKRRERARQEMRDAILDTARQMVEAEGVAKLSLRAIARELGYSPAALYEYFPSKEAICTALYFEGTDGLSGRMATTLATLSPDASAIEAKKALGRAYRRFAHERRELFLLVFGGSGAFTGKEPSLDPVGNGYEALLATAQRGIDAGDFVDLPADMIALTSWSAVHGYVMLELAGLFAEKRHPEEDCPPEETMPNPDALFELHLDLIDQGVSRR